MTGFVIAVDGPAASGKGTVAQGLARLYGLAYLDTGLLYRAVGVLAQRHIGQVTEEAAEAAARTLDPDVLDDPALRTRAAGELVSGRAGGPAGFPAGVRGARRRRRARRPRHRHGDRP
jgi:cytidylate kinase